MNMMKLLGMIDVFPGAKTYITLVFAMGMKACQVMGYHVFSNEAWGIVGINAAIFWKMGQDRVVRPFAKKAK